MTNPHPDRVGATLWIALGSAIFAGAWQMDRYEQMGGTLYTAPGLVPGIYGLLMIALGSALALRRPRHDEATRSSLLNRRIALTLLLTLVYAIGLIGRVPFGPATAVFVATFCWLFDNDSPPRKRALTAILTGLATATVVVLVFERVFLVRLP